VPDPLRLTLRIDRQGGNTAERWLGPGKIRLLETIDREGSISAAGRSLGMSYRRAWLLVEAINESLAVPAVTTRPGGAGGAGLTDTGRMLVAQYRALEQAAADAAAPMLAILRSLQDGSTGSLEEPIVNVDGEEGEA